MHKVNSKNVWNVHIVYEVGGSSTIKSLYILCDKLEDAVKIGKEYLQEYDKTRVIRVSDVSTEFCILIE